jgi:hypothetical protein
MKSRLALLCKTAIFLQVSCSHDDLLLLFWFIWVYFLFIIKYSKLLIIENTVLIFQFYKSFTQRTWSLVALDSVSLYKGRMHGKTLGRNK